MWFQGPKWLHHHFTPPQPPIEDTNEELRKIQNLHAQMSCSGSSLIEKFSSYHKLITLVAFVNRCKGNFKARKLNQPTAQGPFTVSERHRAFKGLCSMVQREFFSKEVQLLSMGPKTEAPDHEDFKKSGMRRGMRKTKLLNFDPFYDDADQLLRIGGRLQHSQLEFGQKHPIILPDSAFTRLYLTHLHVTSLHAGPTLLLATARQQVWIINGKNAARQVVRHCVTCQRWKGQPFSQKMGSLPVARSQGLRACHTVGVDYEGPITLKYRKGP